MCVCVCVCVYVYVNDTIKFFLGGGNIARKSHDDELETEWPLRRNFVCFLLNKNIINAEMWM